MVLVTDYLALVIATVAVLYLTYLNRRHPLSSPVHQDFANRLIQSAQVLLVVAWILLVLVRD